MSNDNLLNKLRQKNRQRANVTDRKDSLFNTSSTEQKSKIEESEIDTSQANKSNLTNVNNSEEEKESNFNNTNNVIEQKDKSNLAKINNLEEEKESNLINLNNSEKQEKKDVMKSKEKSNFNTDNEFSSPTTLAELKQQLDKFPKTRRRSGIVLEEEIDLELTTYCKRNGITVETFLEAAWLIISEKETILKKVTKEASSRYNQRKKAGQLRRLITTLEKIN